MRLAQSSTRFHLTRVRTFKSARSVEIQNVFVGIFESLKNRMLDLMGTWPLGITP